MKDGKSKPPKGKVKAAKQAPEPLLDAETLATQRRVAQLRDKIRHALDDPEKRQQMVEAIRVMMHSDDK
jgi:hypothetical protein